MDDTIERKLVDAEAEARILSLVRRGATAQAVAEHLTSQGYSCDAPSVRKVVKRRLSEVTEHSQLTVEELRAHENERLDDAVRKLYPLIESEQPNLKAINLFLKISERRAKLNGLDAPTRVQIDPGDTLAALGLNRELIDRASAAFAASFDDGEDIIDAEVIDGEEASLQPSQEEGAPRALQAGGGGGRPQEPTPIEKALSDAGQEVEAQPEIPAEVQSLAQKGILEAEGGAYFQRQKPRQRRKQAGPQEDVVPQATVLET